MNRFKRIKEQIMVPSVSAQLELREKIEAAQPAPKGNLWLRRAMPLAACLLLVIGVAVAYQQLRGPGGIIVPPPTTATPIQNKDGKITGLPIDTTPNMPISSVDRSPFNSLESFFYQGDLFGIALVRVTQTQVIPPREPENFSRQLSTLEVIEWVTGESELTSVTVSQSLAGQENQEYVIGGDYQAKLLRQGGVYLLPVGRFDWDGSDYWYVIGDSDVLFEVDEHGNIFSHSSLPAFAAYDGTLWQNLSEDIHAFVRDNPLLAQYPRFARTLRDEVPLAVIAILDGGTKGRRSHLAQRARAEQVLQQGTGRSWQVQLNEGEFALNTYGHEAKALPGERYLAFIYGSEAEYSFQPENAARINEDGTIVPLANEWGGWNAFDELAGMTVEQVRALVEKAGLNGPSGLR